MERKHEQTAKQFCEALQTIASKPENLENLNSYLCDDFLVWLEKWAITPEGLAEEMKNFSTMDIL